MHKFLSFVKEFRIPKKQELTVALRSFSQTEFYVFALATIVAFISMMVILNNLNSKFLVDVPVSGGSITEGIVGMPTLVNPVLATSDADKDITSLVYSGLMRRLPDGKLILDLAESYTVSPDGLTYTFIIKKNTRFHDGEKLTSDDIVYTINKIKDPTTKSPRRVGWEGVSIEKIDDKTIVFKLKEPYISFLDNTTIGILPLHIWKNVKDNEFNISPLNIKAIGSGPYKIKSVTKNKDSIPEEYQLKSFYGFALGNPHIKNITIKSYPNEKEIISALSDGTIDQAGGISPKNASEINKKTYTINTASTSRIFGLFYNNTNNKIFTDANVIKAINYALDRNEIVNEVLFGYGTIVEGPIPNTILENNTTTEISNLDKANELLDKSGWVMGEDGFRTKGGITTTQKTKKVGKKTITETVKVNNGPVIRLEFSLTTGDTPELKKVTELIKSELSKIGISVNTEKVYEMGPLNQVIRDREYEALFFGQIINHESDLYSFWHSSQRKDPGLNISMYSNPKVDKALEEAQKIIDSESRINKYKNILDEFNKDLPALLIYSPKYLYATTTKLNNINLNTIINPSDRFASVYQWYANKDHVWKIFTK